MCERARPFQATSPQSRPPITHEYTYMCVAEHAVPDLGPMGPSWHVVGDCCDDGLGVLCMPSWHVGHAVLHDLKRPCTSGLFWTGLWWTMHKAICPATLAFCVHAFPTRCQAQARRLKCRCTFIRARIYPRGSLIACGYGCGYAAQLAAFARIHVATANETLFQPSLLVTACVLPLQPSALLAR